MSSPWIWQRMDAAVGDAGVFLGGAPMRLVMHTTEVDADPRNGWVGNWRYPSHVVADYEHGIIVQCLPLNRAAKSLYNDVGGVETNRLPCLQVEVNGHAQVADQWPEGKLRWLAHNVVVPLYRWCQDNGVPFTLDDIPAAGPWGMSASVDAPQRMTFARWNAFNSMCSHRHVPENDHADTGTANLERIAQLAKEELEPDMLADERQALMDLRSMLPEVLDKVRAIDTAAVYHPELTGEDSIAMRTLIARQNTDTLLERWETLPALMREVLTDVLSTLDGVDLGEVTAAAVAAKVCDEMSARMAG